MTVTACVNWYNQYPHHLERLLCSLVGRVARVVLADGPYQGLADAAESPPDNYTAIGRFTGLVPVTVIPGAVYPSEAAKRNTIARRAQQLGATRLLVVDSDEALLDTPVGVECLACQDGNPTSITRRVFPAGAVWGPHHAHVESDGRVLWTPEWVKSPDGAYDFRTFHSPAEKRIQALQEAYDQHVRPLVER